MILHMSTIKDVSDVSVLPIKDGSVLPMKMMILVLQLKFRWFDYKVH